MEKQVKTLKQKINEPIINIKKLFAIMMTLLWEVVSNLIPFIAGVKVDPIWIIFNITMGIVVISFIAIMRAAYPLEVPDSSITQALFLFFKRVVDALFNYNMKDGTERDEALSLLERNIVWSIHEWDIINKEKLKEFVDYYKKKNGNAIVAEEIEEKKTPSEPII